LSIRRRKDVEKIVLGLFLALIAAGAAMAQDWGGKKNFASIDLGLIMGGRIYA
jgi:hypothetical protein